MPKYYCDYCDTFLTHDSPSVRKTHNGGRKHKETSACTYDVAEQIKFGGLKAGKELKENVRMFYQKWMEEQAQKLVDATTKAFTQGRMNAAAPAVPAVGGAAMPRMPMPIPGARGAPLIPSMGPGPMRGPMPFPYPAMGPPGMMMRPPFMMPAGPRMGMR